MINYKTILALNNVFTSKKDTINNVEKQAHMRREEICNTCT